MPLAEGHREVKELERIFDAHFGGLADVLIHLDPCTDPGVALSAGSIRVRFARKEACSSGHGDGTL